jgi:hypothetical protein
LFFVYGCLNYKYVKAFEGPDVPTNQIAKLYLDKGKWTKPDRNRPISFVIDGKPYKYDLSDLTPCLFILPGEHEIIILPERQRFTESTRDSSYYAAPHFYTATTWNVYPIPNQHILRFNAEKGREYLVAEKYPDSWNWDYMIFWIEDGLSKNRITDEVRFDWK